MLSVFAAEVLVMRDQLSSPCVVCERFLLHEDFVLVFALLLWTTALHLNGLVDHVPAAMLFAGSCYTTLCLISDNLPLGWQSACFAV